MYLTDEYLAPLVARYGQPRLVTMEQEIGRGEMDMVLASRKDGRAHDVTGFILDDRHRLACIRKPFFVPGAWRAPSGGIHPGEDVEQGIKREMKEETGLDIELLAYLLRIDVRFTSEGRVQPWVSHIFAARALVPRPVSQAAVPVPGNPTPVNAAAGEWLLEPEDKEEIAAAGWVTVDELLGPVRRILLGTGQGLFRYRVALTDMAIEEMRKRGLLPERLLP